MNEVIELFEKTFKTNRWGCQWGSCTEDFLLEKAIETIRKASTNTEDRVNLEKLFTENMYRNLGRFSNGKHAGKWYISIIKEYFDGNRSENNV